MSITKSDLTNTVQYQGAKMGEGFALIGFVDVKHGDILVFHNNLTERNLDEVEGLTAVEIQALAQTEADNILALEVTQKVLDDYVALVNLGLYPQG